MTGTARRSPALGLLAAVLAAVAVATSTVETSNATYTAAATTTITSGTGTLFPPTGATTLRDSKGATTTWAAPTSGVAVGGYSVQRATSATGPFGEVASVDAKTLSYYDASAATGTGVTYYYKIVSKRGGWNSDGLNSVAPPPVSDVFFDDFEAVTADLNNQPTKGGASRWLVWAGGFKTGPGAVGTGGTKGSLFATTRDRSLAVVRTSAHDANLYASDLDGYEGIVLRGSDPSNYILFTSSDRLVAATTTQNLRIIKVENGVETLLAVTPARVLQNLNARVVVRGDTVTVYQVTDEKTPLEGAPVLLTTKTTFNQGNPTATYFGASITGSTTFFIDDFYFNAL